MKGIHLSVIVPAYNEEQTIKHVLTELLKQKDVFEVVVVNDASKDKTAQVVKSVISKKIKLISHKTNMGKGKAIQTGLMEVKGDYVLIQDADLEYDPKEIPILLDPIKSGRTHIVFGSRFFGAHTNMFYWHFVGNKLLNFVINIMYNTTLSDMETCYKVLPTDLMKSLSLKENDFRIEPEITCKLLKENAVIMEVPITYVGRSYEDGKKITWVDWFKAVSTIFAIRLESAK